jgi:isopentenyl-diphosphate delta-isomerase
MTLSKNEAVAHARRIDPYDVRSSASRHSDCLPVDIACQGDQEAVVLVDEHNQVVGTMPKATVHGRETPLHRGFSSFIFRSSDRRLLLQQRSASKRTWPLVWSNSCCGHPGLGESNIEAARRRLKAELGLDPTMLEEVAPYRYCFSRDGIMENEICPILIGLVESEPVINPDEVQAVRWTKWSAFLDEIECVPERYSDWCVEQAGILQGLPRLREMIAI